MKARRRALAIAAAVAVGLVCTGSSAVASTDDAAFPLGAIGGLAQPLNGFLPQAAATSSQAPPGVVRAVGTHLVVDGRPWRFIGYNDYKLTSQTYGPATPAAASTPMRRSTPTSPR